MRTQPKATGLKQRKEPCVKEWGLSGELEEARKETLPWSLHKDTGPPTPQC